MMEKYWNLFYETYYYEGTIYKYKSTVIYINIPSYKSTVILVYCMHVIFLGSRSAGLGRVA